MQNPAKLGFSWQRQEPDEPPQEEPQILEQKEIILSVEDVLKIFSDMKVSMVDMSILKKFYMEDKPTPFGTTSWCASVLYGELKEQLHLETKYDNFYSKIIKFERRNMVARSAPHCNPIVFDPIDRFKFVIRKAMIVWLARHGLKLL